MWICLVRGLILSCTETQYLIEAPKVDSISVNKFRNNLKGFVEQIVSEHSPLKVTRRNGDDFVVLSADDWAREQETLYVLQNNDLMKQIAASTASNVKNKGYKPTVEELSEITGI